MNLPAGGAIVVINIALFVFAYAFRKTRMRSRGALS
jgi:hypothetical protein